MNTVKIISIAVILSFFHVVAYSDNVTIPKTFESGDTLTAADLNNNNTAIKTAVDDNDSRITSNTDNISNNASDLTSINAAISYLQNMVTDLQTRVTLLESGKNKINIDFGTHAGTPSNNYSAASNQFGYWNEIGLGTGIPLTDVTGKAGITIDVTADTPTGYGNCTSGDASLLLCDNFYSASGATWIISIAGLINGNYSVYIYAPNHAAVSTGDMHVNGTSVTSIPGDGDNILTEGVSYVVVQNVSVSDGTLTISGTSAFYSGLSGLQIVP